MVLAVFLVYMCPRMEVLIHYLWLVPVGVLLGLFGTVIGAGGGFLLVPLLLLLYPNEKPEVITSISLAVVGINAISGSISYARMKRINYRAGGLFALATIPGAILGAITTAVLPPHLFHLTLGAAIFAVGVSLLGRPGAPRGQEVCGGADNQDGDGAGCSSRLDFNRSFGVLLSMGVGYLSSLLGIGGGIIHVPALVHLLH